MTGVSDVEADNVGTDIVAEVLRYKSGYNSGTIAQNGLIFWTQPSLVVP